MYFTLILQPHCPARSLNFRFRLRTFGSEFSMIVRALLAGSQSNALTPSRLLRLSKDLPHDWKEQRCFLGFAA